MEGYRVWEEVRVCGDEVGCVGAGRALRTRNAARAAPHSQVTLLRDVGSGAPLHQGNHSVFHNLSQ